MSEEMGFPGAESILNRRWLAGIRLAFHCILGGFQTPIVNLER
jgi:hypothetical protein